MERQSAAKPSYLTENLNEADTAVDRQIQKLLRDAHANIKSAKEYMLKNSARYAQDIEDLYNILTIFKNELKMK